MGKRSPNDLTPPDQIIDWADERQRVLRAEGLKFFEVPAAEPVDWYGNQYPPPIPGLSHELGLPPLRCNYNERRKILKTEGANFRKRWDEGGYRVKTTDEIREEQDSITDLRWLCEPCAFPESDRSYNGDLPGALTAEGMRLMDNLPSETPIEELEDQPVGGEVFWCMARSRAARLKRLREKEKTHE